MNTPEKVCPACGTHAPIHASACQQCSHVYRTKFTPPLEQTQMYQPPATATPYPPQPLQPVQPQFPAPPAYPMQPQQPGQQYPGQPPQGYSQNYSPGPPAAPVNVFVSTPVTVNNNSNGGWWAALLVLLFATPVGWIGLLVLLVLLILAVKAALLGLPILAAAVAAILVARLDGSRLDPAKKPAIIGGILLLGVLVNAGLWWFAFRQTDQNAPAVASPASEGRVTVPPANDSEATARELRNEEIAREWRATTEVRSPNGLLTNEPETRSGFRIITKAGGGLPPDTSNFRH